MPKTPDDDKRALRAIIGIVSGDDTQTDSIFEEMYKDTRGPAVASLRVIDALAAFGGWFLVEAKGNEDAALEFLRQKLADFTLEGEAETGS